MYNIKKMFHLVKITAQKITFSIIPIQGGPFLGCSWMEMSLKRSSPHDLSRISYNDKISHSYALPKKDPLRIFSQEISNFS